MNLREVLNYRRSVRVYDKEKNIDADIVKDCIELSTLAPNSSNMQLWEAYHILSPSALNQMTKACLNQTSVSTASQLVVFVTRQDLYPKRADANIAFERDNIQRNSPEERQEKRIKDRLLYYGKLMPFLYSQFFGVFGFVRKLAVSTVGIFRPIVYQVSESDMRIVIHKSCALAAQTFMIAMANEGYDTCPLEGFDSKRVKKLLKLPRGAEINMVVSCGIRKGNEGIWGERFRIPFNEVYHKI
ncbi:nitroreductase family protein [Sphingobacterium pedocola]|uniref:Nitroreductase family protein n=1 Tax=Sphingobacterium pedocola TaxID=2082722 RepID=A0ABR9T2L5_9SPHI|nr:nitroreductase family protein [Sphingobacterium pedocola]MBE8719593.1 nitroreductase family protein [Sphingobacterium pedocola]